MVDLDELQIDRMDANNLTEEEELKIAAKMLGYKYMPVDIETFIEDPYYLGEIFGNGQLFPYWKDKLKQLFPTPITISKLFVVLTGAIGTGKSTFTRICSLYLQHRMDCLADPWRSMGIAKGKSLNFVFFHTTASKAQSDFVDPNNNNKAASPYFSSGRHNPDLALADIVDGVRSNNSIGGDTVMQCLSELNFVPRNIADYKLQQGLKRIQSRFLKCINYFVLIIIDTSSRGDNSVADDFIKNNPFGEDQVMVVRAAIWEAKAGTGIYFRKGHFYAYAGDTTHQPFIFNDGVNPYDELAPDMDPDRVLKVPAELRGGWELNITEAIQDEAGRSTYQTGKYIDKPDQVKVQFNKPMYSDDIIAVDFYNKADKLIYQLDRYLRDIPKDAVIFPRYDIGVVSDLCGIAITYFAGYEYFDKSSRKVKLPRYVTPLALALSRKQGEETSIYHLFDFIMDLNERFQIGEFTCDGFGSLQLLQDTKREGIKNRLLSVDRTDAAHIYFKNQLFSKLWNGPDNKLLFKEICELKFDGRKFDRARRAGEGHKDISDAVIGSVYSCFENLDIAEQLSGSHKIQRQGQWLKDRISINELSGVESQLYGMFG